MYRSWVAAAALQVVCACSNSQSAVDAGGPFTCVMSGGTWTCPGNPPSPQCPGVNAANPINTGDPCSFDGGCFYCSRESVGNGCACNADGDGGTAWQCVGAGFACMP